jgi:hypothetical protein
VHLDLFHVEPFTLCNHEVQSDELWGAFLSMAAVAVSSGALAGSRPWSRARDPGRGLATLGWVVKPLRGLFASRILYLGQGCKTPIL